MESPIVSQEYLKVGNSHRLGLGVFGIIEALRKETTKVATADLDGLSKFIKDESGLTIKFALNNDAESGIAIQVMPLPGYAGTSGRYQDHLYIGDEYATEIHGRYLKSKIDLDKVKVTGGLSMVEYTMHVPSSLLRETPASTLITEEVTALFLHEIGHAFWGLATIGEYVWMNYFLQEGVEIALGKKSNVYRIEVLDTRWLSKNVTDPKLAAEIQQAPTENNVRKAIIDVKTNRPRDAMYSVSGAGSWKRDEQMADWFASRMGFGRPLATALYKIQKVSVGHRFYRSKQSFIAIEIIKVLWGVSLFSLPVTKLPLLTRVLVTMFIVNEVKENFDWGDYDNPTERIQKVRRSIVADMKSGDLSPAMRQNLLDDLKIVDGLINSMNQWMTYVEILSYVFLPSHRKTKQRLKAEAELEQLLNNDLFVATQRLRQL